MEVLSIAGEARTELGKKSTKEIRRNNRVPAVIYGGEKEVHFSVDSLDVRSLIYTADFKIAEITVDGKSYKAILKDSQYHPVSDNLLHMDFQELVEGNAVLAEVPLRIIGTAVGVRAGGKLTQKVRRVKIKTTPASLVDSLSVDVSELELGKSMRIRDIQVPDGVQMMNPEANPVVSVIVPRAMRSEASAAGSEKGAEEASAEVAAE